MKEKHFHDSYKKEGFIDENEKSHLDQLEALGQLFKKVTEDDTPTEVSIDVLNTLTTQFLSSGFSVTPTEDFRSQTICAVKSL